MKRLAYTTALLFLFACQDTGTPTIIEEGIPLAIAEGRALSITELSYEISLQVPGSLDERIKGTSVIAFDWQATTEPLVIDFRTTPQDVLSVTLNDKTSEYEWINGHIVINPSQLNEGRNSLNISYLAGNSSLNRNEDYLYTLFVPDRASHALPCFDQPDLKATYDLTLQVPAGWSAVGNGPLQPDWSSPDKGGYRFISKDPIPTYLFAFAAGVFETETVVRGGRTMTMYHRESDASKVSQNRKAIFDLHFSALDWLEDYTGIDYPFEKFDFVCIPSFQYGGMEHPGAILYRASSLFLEPSATKVDELRRASLIAHETAHMWFGNLVTMRWFNDVWMKEVFANFMAAKVVNPSFPEVNHDLRFFLAHYPRAYSVDRTAGSHPIRQELDNLKDAGTLYGSIIYQKAPIVMRQLELILGEQKFQQGLRTYLERHAHANATWLDLISIFDELSTEDIGQWSAVWVEEAGRPEISAEWTSAVSEDKGSIVLHQTDRQGIPKVWNQRIKVAAWPSNVAWDDRRDLQLSEYSTRLNLGEPPTYLLPNSAGFGYGYFALDDATINFLLAELPKLEDPVMRAVALVNLWEEMLSGRVDPAQMLEVLLIEISSETDDQLAQRALSYLERCFWTYQPAYRWEGLAPKVEEVLWDLLEYPPSDKLQLAYFRSLSSLALSTASLLQLEAILKKQAAVEGLTIGERDRTRLAFQLALKQPGREDLLAYQRSQIESSDQGKRFDFIAPSVSGSEKVQEDFFQSLQKVDNRSQEPWVLEAVGYLHHPLRSAHSVAFIEPSLELLEEIQTTGDIFFPKRWMDVTLGGHQSDRAARIVRSFLEARPNYPKPLQQKILQAADPVFRSSTILDGGSQVK